MGIQTSSSESYAIKNIETAIFFLSFSFFIMGLLLPIYGKELGASAFEIGVIFSAFSVVTILMRPLVGWVLDRFNPTIPFFATGLVLALCGLLLIVFLQIPQTIKVESTR